MTRRAAGGIGDILCCSVAMRAAKQAYGNHFECVATFGLRRWVQLFQDQPDVADSWAPPEQARADRKQLLQEYATVFDLDGPESRAENMAEHTAISRVEAWVDAVLPDGMDRPTDMCPHWTPTYDEVKTADDWIAANGLHEFVVVQLRSDKGLYWRDYPRTPQVIERLAKLHPVLVLHDQKFSLDIPQTSHPVVSHWQFDLRQLGTVLRQAKLVVAPDSSFVHFAAAVDVPCLGLFGATSGKMTTKYYPKAKFVQAPRSRDMSSQDFWRSATPGTLSACMEQIEVDHVISVATEILSAGS